MFSYPAYPPGNRAGLKQSKQVLSHLQTEGAPNFPPDACHAFSCKLSPQSWGTACTLALVCAQQRQAWGCEEGAPCSQGLRCHPWRSLCPLFVPPAAARMISSILRWFCKPCRSAASRGSEGTSRDLAAVAYTVQNNFLLLWLFLMCFIQFQPNQVKCFRTLSFFRLFTEGKCNLP